MFFSRVILTSLVLFGCLAHARYLVERDSVADGRIEAKFRSKIVAFLQRKVNALVSTKDNPNTNLINLAYSIAEDNDYTFAVLRSFSDFNANILNIGTERLEGCTVLTVVSRKAVYMAHFFENLAFAPDDGKAPDSAFEQNCINQITGRGQTWRTRGDSIDPSLFTGNNGPAFAYIMTPRQEQADPTRQNPNPPVPGPDTQLYAERMRQLSQTLTSLIPGLWVVYYNYIAANAAQYEEQDAQQHRGKALFEYDPNADGNNNANFRIWYEQNMENGQGAGLFA
ncbi:hypothetical protein E0Z10_g10548 [Xylaria hypoxylon]|uniref:Uncharacterized protein n=1 Tax=Xylaria hypoxylon TaxID=37992 RepID=A0A4Z0YNJ0_9PEZI|nr:hypothetical protein E0Z10_g10548 [Xylaria hypoxylon]